MPLLTPTMPKAAAGNARLHCGYDTSYPVGADAALPVPAAAEGAIATRTVKATMHAAPDRVNGTQGNIVISSAAPRVSAAGNGIGQRPGPHTARFDGRATVAAICANFVEIATKSAQPWSRHPAQLATRDESLRADSPPGSHPDSRVARRLRVAWRADLVTSPGFARGTTGSVAAHPIWSIGGGGGWRSGAREVAAGEGSDAGDGGDDPQR